MFRLAAQSLDFVQNLQHFVQTRAQTGFQFRRRRFGKGNDQNFLDVFFSKTISRVKSAAMP